MENLNEIIQTESDIADRLECLLTDICSKTASKEMPGVTSIAGNVAAITVSFSSLDKGILSPEYYIQSRQAELVRQRLASAKTATEFRARIEDMANAGSVKIGCNTRRLNSMTVQVLQEYL